MDADGNVIKDPDVLKRIKALVIPPMWTDVLVCAECDGHLQATGRDQKGRKQYIYHPEWEKERQGEKFARLGAFGRKLPKLRKKIQADLKRRGWPKDKVVALMASLLDQTGIRIGNKCYQQQNNTFGLSTLRRKHMQLEGNSLILQYRGKSAQEREVEVTDPLLVRHVKRVAELPGYELFKYRDDEGCKRTLDSHDVQEYIQRVLGKEFSCKDFRTWVASRLAVEHVPLARKEKESSPRKNEETILVRMVAEELGNTLSVCRQYYIHPTILKLFSEGKMPTNNPFRETNSPAALSKSEKLLLKLLE